MGRMWFKSKKQARKWFAKSYAPLVKERVWTKERANRAVRANVNKLRFARGKNAEPGMKYVFKG